MRHWALTSHVVVVDEDYSRGGLTGEVAATLLSAGLHPGFRRVAVETTIPLAPSREYQALPNAEHAVTAGLELLDPSSGRHR